MAAAIREGIDDFLDSWRRRRVAHFFAWTETVARYRRSVLGPFWLVLGTAIGVVGLGFVWSILLDVDFRDFVPRLTVGLITWQLISSTILEASGLFPRNGSSITNIRLPSFLLSMQQLWRQVINFAHNLIVVVVVWLIFPEHISPTLLLAIPGVILVMLNLLALTQLTAFFGARFRDVEPLISAIMPLLFFLSPVIYESRELGPAQNAILLNPIAHWISVIRDPMLGTVPDIAHYLVTIVGGTALWLLALWVTGSRNHRLPYWV